jgi:hypothetical protein
MTEHEASRTLVKSAPELWAECSDAGSLARHLGQFGEIRITRLEPETSVAWEGEHASGTVRLEPSGWGTRVILTARPVPDEEAPPAADPEPAPDPLPPVAEEAQDMAVVDAAPEEPPDVVQEPSAVHDDGTDVDVPSTAQAPAKVGFMARLRAKFGGKREEPSEADSPQDDPDPPVVDEPTDDGQPPELADDVGTTEPPEEPEPVVQAAPVTELDPAAEATPAAKLDPAAETTSPSELDPAAALTAALDSLGQAHHRPFSRA